MVTPLRVAAATARAGLLAATLLVVTGFVAAGCDGDGDTTTSLRSIADSTDDATTARFAVSETSGDDTRAPTHAADGVFDFDRLDGRVKAKGPRRASEHVIIAGGAVYVPMTNERVDPDDPCAGKAWGVFDYPRHARDETLAAIGETIPADFASPVPLDPSQVLESLAQSDAAISAIGTDTVRGVHTIRYRVDDVEPDLRERLQQGDDEASLTRLEVFVDPRGRLRRAVWTLHHEWTDVDGTTFGHDATTTVELWDFGVEVDVAAPSADDTCDYPELFARTMATFD
jgi:hypothetical protein